MKDCSKVTKSVYYWEIEEIIKQLPEWFREYITSDYGAHRNPRDNYISFEKLALLLKELNENNPDKTLKNDTVHNLA